MCFALSGLSSYQWSSSSNSELGEVGRGPTLYQSLLGFRNQSSHNSTTLQMRSERFSNLPKATKEVRGRVGVGAHLPMTVRYMFLCPLWLCQSPCNYWQCLTPHARVSQGVTMLVWCKGSMKQSCEALRIAGTKGDNEYLLLMFLLLLVLLLNYLLFPRVGFLMKRHIWTLCD